MSIRTLESSSQPKVDAVPRPPLSPGDQLTRAEFERRYRAHPEIKKAELIEGVVCMPSPIRFFNHCQPYGHTMGWLTLYYAHTPGVMVGDNASARLDYENEVQPDALLRLDGALGEKSRVTEDDYLAGPPELVMEIAASSAAYDMHIKRRVYARIGVQEYLVVQMYECRVDWFVWREGVVDVSMADPFPAAPSLVNDGQIDTVPPQMAINAAIGHANDLVVIESHQIIAVGAGGHSRIDPGNHHVGLF